MATSVVWPGGAVLMLRAGNVASSQKQQKLKFSNGEFYGPALACEKVKVDSVFAVRAVDAFEPLSVDGLREKVAFGGPPPSSSSSSAGPSDKFTPRFSRGAVMERRGRRGQRVVTSAIPVDAYWITAAEAVTVAGLMAGIAAVAGVMMNIRVEVEALKEYKELEAKGMLPDEFIIPDEDYDLAAPLYIFQNKELSASAPRKRPVREEFETEEQPKSDLKTELEPATSNE